VVVSDWQTPTLKESDKPGKVTDEQRKNDTYAINDIYNYLHEFDPVIIDSSISSDVRGDSEIESNMVLVSSYTLKNGCNSKVSIIVYQH
jgi:hypothetical protein